MTPCSRFPGLSGICFSELSPKRLLAPPVLLRARFFVTASTLLFVRPTAVAQSFRHPSSFHSQFCHHTPRFVFLRSIASIDYSHTPSFKSSHSWLDCPSLPIDHPDMFQRYLLWMLRTDIPHVHRRLPLTKQGVPLQPHLMSRSRVSHMTAPASPLTCLHVCTSNALVSICSSTRFCPEELDNDGEILFALQIVYLHDQRYRDRLLLACCCRHLPLQLLRHTLRTKCPRLGLATLSQKPRNCSSTFPHQSSKKILRDAISYDR